MSDSTGVTGTATTSSVGPMQRQTRAGSGWSWSRRAILIGSVSVGLLLAAAAPAVAFSKRTNAGSPGAVYGLDQPYMQGGICQAPGETDPTNCPTTRNQLFVDRFRIYSANYAAYQNISVDEYLYYNAPGTSTWTYWLHHQQTFSAVAGSGSASVKAGSPSPQIAGNCSAVPGGCVPAFTFLPAGYYYTVLIRVTWINYSTGRTLAQADFFPNQSADIGCAAWAISHGRCSGPTVGTYGLNLNAPGGQIAFIYMSPCTNPSSCAYPSA